MGQLNSGNGVLRLDKVTNALKWRNMLFFPYARAVGTDSASRLHSSCFRHHNTRTTNGASTEVHQMPVIDEAILARVLTHGRNAYAILAQHIADLNGSEQQRFALGRVTVGCGVHHFWYDRTGQCSLTGETANKANGHTVVAYLYSRHTTPPMCQSVPATRQILMGDNSTQNKRGKTHTETKRHSDSQTSVKILSGIIS